MQAAVFTRSAEPARVTPMLGIQDENRLRRWVRDDYQFVWRCLRRLGVSSADLDDAVQEVFLVLAKRLPTLPAEAEKSFIFRTCSNLALHARRRRVRKPELIDEQAVTQRVDEGNDPEQAAAHAAALTQLDAVLAAMPCELREIMIMSDLEEMKISEIGMALELPQGTVASRIRRARELFALRLQEMSL